MGVAIGKSWKEGNTGAYSGLVDLLVKLKEINPITPKNICNQENNQTIEF